MADITMCRDDKCKDKKACYRYTAIPNEYWQSYFLPKNKQEENNKDSCEFFINNKKKISCKR